jgi:hypothetical protein
MLAGLQTAGEKLKDYYDKTTEGHGNFMLWAPSLRHNTSYSSSHSRNDQIMSPNGGTYIINTSKVTSNPTSNGFLITNPLYRSHKQQSLEA